MKNIPSIQSVDRETCVSKDGAGEKRGEKEEKEGKIIFKNHNRRLEDVCTCADLLVVGGACIKLRG